MDRWRGRRIMSSYPHPDPAHVPPNTLAVTITPPDTVTSTHMLTGTSSSPLPPSQCVHTHARAHTRPHMSTRAFTHHHSQHRRRGRMSLRWLCLSHPTLFLPIPPGHSSPHPPCFPTPNTSKNLLEILRPGAWFPRAPRQSGPPLPRPSAQHFP